MTQKTITSLDRLIDQLIRHGWSLREIQRLLKNANSPADLDRCVASHPAKSASTRLSSLM